MTMRLLCRLARVLPRSTRGSSAASALLQTSAAQSAEPLWSQSRHRPLVAARGLCDRHGLAREEESNFVFKRTPLDGLVSSAKSPEEVLRLWEGHGGNANQAAICLNQISRLALERSVEERRQLVNDPRCAALLHTVGSEAQSVWNGTLVSVLRAVSQLDTPPGDAVLRSLETEALWRVRRFSYKQLAYLMEWALTERARLARLGQGDGPALANELAKQLELRWTELSEPRTVGVLMGRAAHLPPSLIEKLEDKALELAEHFVAEDIRRVAHALASQGRRTVPLLRALSYHLLQRPSKELSTALLLDIAYAYGKLNFHQTQVFQRVAAELLPRTPDLSSTDVTRCAKSFAFLKWLHLPLFEAFTEHYVANSEKYSTLQLWNLLMSLAKLNFQPSKGEAFFDKVHSALKDTLPHLDPFLQVDVVWSLCVMQQVKPEYLTSFAQPSFQEKLKVGSAARVENYRVKLQHIMAERILGGLGSSVPSSSPTPEPTRTTPPSQLQTALHAALTSLTDAKPNTLRTSIATCYGWPLDGELILDSENKPIELDTLTAPHLPGGGGDKPLPEGAMRMGFVAWEFPNFVLRTKGLLGRFAMQKRHLQLAGFHLVEVPYYEWLELKADWQRVAYLKDKMGKAVAEEMAK
ncbi:FAST kinase domain-containing protein 4 [Clupea harengus]|uniref:FAST kinase domain-containing protein 4 n=1 Tax=Clupea harengus TaxID=7950 RepID=A0A6P3WBQ3_CLUHA|nr:FAST kinase domain-containing protein 4 [Clupea harengus]